MSAGQIALMAGLAAVAPAAIQGVQAFQEAQADKAQADLEAGLLNQQAESVRLQTEADEADFRNRQSRAFAARRAALGGAGVQLAAGSPLLVSQDFASEVELAALRIRSGGEIASTRLEQQAGFTRFLGRQKKEFGQRRAGALLVSGAADAVSKSFTFGAFPSTSLSKNFRRAGF